MELKTPLYEEHVALKGTIVPFAGYLLPVQYPTGIIKEHMAVREHAGLFDVSHMGEITFRGETALQSLNHILTNDYTDMKIGKVRYGVMLNDDGGVIDDLIVYKFAEDYYFVVVNASNRHKDFEHMKKNVLPGTEITDISDSLAQVALQGPASFEIMERLLKKEDIPYKYYTAKEHVSINGMDAIISFTGYTGEKGFEIYVASENGPALWNLLLETGKDLGLIPCGLGARDTLRLEAAMPLYGHEMDDTISPLETGLDYGVRMSKEEFIGRDALIRKGKPTIARVGLEMIDRGIMREHQDIYSGETLIGHTTSGTHCPYLKKAVAMAFIDKKYAEPGTELVVDIRGKKAKVRVVPLPFYKRK
ncbi:MAG: glycine cleavage system aminomethyltransferase GcvT [Clostridia bacterium]|nr:glycine cleavage system aminomethyltransferase GcvT [Clostridia bacterium]